MNISARHIDSAIRCKKIFSGCFFGVGGFTFGLLQNTMSQIRRQLHQEVLNSSSLQESPGYLLEERKQITLYECLWVNISWTISRKWCMVETQLVLEKIG
jgi:hypothetical protein